MASVSLWCQDLYQIDHITTIDITFLVDDWDEQMDMHYEADEGERLIGSCYINGEFYDGIGVAFKGNSTYNPSNLKNPLNIKLDYSYDQKYQGYSSLKLSNGDKDPSFVREVLSYEIGRSYMDMPLSNYAKVTINGNYYGLFSSSESINSDYQERRLYCDDDNTRFKCNPVSVFDGGSSLEYLGSDSSDYYDFYELKSDLGWSDLVDFTYELENNISGIEAHLDVDRALWMLAFNNVLVNLDSYTGPFKQNYYMIKDDADRFMPIVWDLNQSLGSFSMVEMGGGGGPPSIDDMVEMDLFIREDVDEYPLISQLFSMPRYRKMYVAHLKTIVEEYFMSGVYMDRANEIQDIIEAEVGAEPNGFYSVTEFNSNLSSAVGGGGGGPGGGSIYGISQIMEDRIDFIESQPEFDYIAPTISDIVVSEEFPLAYTSVTVTASVLDADYAFLAYRNDLQNAFNKVEMFDDGAHGDGVAGDNVYGVTIDLGAKDVQYYLYADNDLAGRFSPVRAAHSYYSITVGAEVVINEIMPWNEKSVMDQDGEYDDWIELYNTTSDAIDLSGYYLTDRPNSEPLKWEIPDGTIIEGNDYLIVWMDADTTQEGLHANFKLSASGETVSFSDADGFTLAKVKYPEMGAETSFGRYENGVGAYIRMIPTFAAENSYTTVSLEDKDNNRLELKVFPNPTNNVTNLYLKGDLDEAYAVKVYNILGEIVFQEYAENQQQLVIPSKNFGAGLYIVTVVVGNPSEASIYSRKIIVE